jgi:deoxyribonuclease IV
MSCSCTNPISCCSSVGITGSLANGLIDSLEVCKTLKCRCVQIVPDSRIFPVENYDIEKAKALDFLTSNNISFYVHCPIWCNLSLSPAQDEKSIVNKSKGIVQSQLNQISNLPAACVLHIGTGGTIENVADKINNMNINEGKSENFSKQLLMEISSGQGAQLGSNWEEIRKLYEAVDKPIGLCFDTQHGFGSGMIDWANCESVVKLFDTANEVSGGIQLFHLNDSKVDFKSNVDRHAGLGKGKIWYKNKESLKCLLERCREEGINMVLETGDSQLKDLKLVDELLEIKKK